MGGATLIGFHEREQLAKYLANVRAIQFIDDQDEWPRWLAPGALTEAKEQAVRNLKGRRCGTPPLNEVLVAVALVELNRLQA